MTKSTIPALTAEKADEELAYTLGVQAYLWGITFLEHAKTGIDGLKARAVARNTFRMYPTLKTAKDRFIVTPNNVTIDGYGIAEVTDEPAIVYVPKLSEERWYIVQIGDYYDEIAHNIGAAQGGSSPASMRSPAPTSGASFPARSRS